MKRIFEHPPEPLHGKKYWRSLEELADKPEFKEWLQREFPTGAAEMEMDGLSRRSFLRLMGASMALAGLSMAGCRRPELYLVPFTKSPEWLVPGKALQYATTMPRRMGGFPVLATCVDGRPIKMEGNPIYPGSNGGTDVFTQASVLDLYDPNRARFFKKDNEIFEEADFRAVLDEIRKEFLTIQGQGLAFLCEANPSPTRERLRTELIKQFPNAIWSVYEPVSNHNETEAVEAVFGGRSHLVHDYAKADVILSLDRDFCSGEGSAQAIQGFSAGRRRGVDGNTEKMSRLYVVESRFSLTGGMADHRLRLPSSEIPLFAAMLAQELSKQGVGGLTNLLAGSPVDFSAAGLQDAWVRELAKDLIANRGRTLIVVGQDQPASVHALVAAMNQALGSFGQTVKLIPNLNAPASTLQDLAAAISANQIATLFILGGNPIYNAPADLNWDDLQKKVPHVMRLGMHEDETSEYSEWHIPATHFLETWGDSRSADGTYLMQQPMILPLFGGLSEYDILAHLIGQQKTATVDLVKETFRSLPGTAGVSFDDLWHQTVHDGFLANSASPSAAANFRGGAVASLWAKYPPVALGADEYEITFYPSPTIDDGRYINNGWLQETPDPMTKLTWDNAALVSPATAKKLGIDSTEENGTNVESQITNFPMIRLTVDGRQLDVVAMVAPGQSDQSIALALGYGQRKAGFVGKKTGFNAYALRTSAMTSTVPRVEIQKIADTYHLGITQQHNSMEGRGLVREANADFYHEHPDFVKMIGIDAEQPYYPHLKSAYENPPLAAPMQWGMTIDLNTCVGCNACIVGCQSENNIPIVGKEQVMRGRAMHWIRTDRYFSGEVEDPQMLIQPMACQHCENAPCETVCPVNATIHSEEGLNVMVYNRCIGTRYCANNCPYKVRRFNFFNYNERPLDELYLGPLAKKGMPETLKMQKNPNVTVRIRGVMEKCTYCVQRIETAKIDQLVTAGQSADTTVKTDSFKTACQQACPAEAIVFGNIADPESRVSKLKKSNRDYGVLAYLNTKPRTSYLGRVRNPNMAMPDAPKVGHSSIFKEEAAHVAPANEEVGHTMPGHSSNEPMKNEQALPNP